MSLLFSSSKQIIFRYVRFVIRLLINSLQIVEYFSCWYAVFMSQANIVESTIVVNTGSILRLHILSL